MIKEIVKIGKTSFKLNDCVVIRNFKEDEYSYTFDSVDYDEDVVSEEEAHKLFEEFISSPTKINENK